MIKMNQGFNKRPTGQKIVILTMFIILGLDFIGMFSDMLIDETLMLNFVLMGAVTSFILFAIAFFPGWQ